MKISENEDVEKEDDNDKKKIKLRRRSRRGRRDRIYLNVVFYFLVVKNNIYLFWNIKFVNPIIIKTKM